MGSLEDETQRRRGDPERGGGGTGQVSEVTVATLQYDHAHSTGEDPHQVSTLSLRSRRVSTARRRRTSTMTILKLISGNPTENHSISERNPGSVRSVSRYFEFSPTPSP